MQYTASGSHFPCVEWLYISLILHVSIVYAVGRVFIWFYCLEHVLRGKFLRGCYVRNDLVLPRYQLVKLCELFDLALTVLRRKRKKQVWDFLNSCMLIDWNKSSWADNWTVMSGHTALCPRLVVCRRGHDATIAMAHQKILVWWPRCIWPHQICFVC